MGDIMKIVTSLEESSLMIKAVSEIIKNKAKKQKSGLLGMILGPLGASFLGNMLAGKGVITASEGVIARSQGQGAIKAGQDY